ncbi:Oidioi.mRNA.OKI2018_I69.chr1.g105.t1.cds [Oikopleura dioica]|uniref:Oidioi.mRNA.OKI2018_I69.chr1.g105.t1.cds n=1 Tax=Oikopleura dioica TaxID=34765 RepID=A0ABN7SJA8_OIKDI|nr:Oidioi.mRNA.OKI2018_I69.chr1.g105.t1.cds [Oikopleura dioica]
MKFFSLVAGAAASSYETTEAYTMSTMNSEPWTTPDRITNCGGTIRRPKTFSSPDFASGSYQNYLSCTWDISLRGVAGFWIVPKTFDIESIGFWHDGQGYDLPDHGPKPNCAFDHVKVIANGVESNFCGTNLGVASEAGKGTKEEGGKWTPDLVNASEDGFKKMFVLGGDATVSMTTDFTNGVDLDGNWNRFAGFEFELVEADRLDIIEYYFGKIAGNIIDERKFNRFVNRFHKILAKARSSATGENCYEENGFGASDTSDDVQVFHESNTCTLNSQVNAALNSWARNNACVGRGKVYRQIIRAARKIRNFYNSANDC